MLRGLVAAGLWFLAAGAAADIEFSNFASTKNLSVIGDAHRSKSALRLTDSVHYQAGAVWYRVKQPVVTGFETTFIFRLTQPDAAGIGGADGLAFVVQNESPKAIGGFGASAGFMRSDAGAPPPFARGIVRRVAVFFDTFANGWDANGNHVAICTNGNDPDLRWPPRCAAYSQFLPVDLKDGEPHTGRIVYHPPQLSVYLDEEKEPVRTASLDLAGIIGGDGTAWVGFTAATGDGYQNHDLLAWKFDVWPRAASSVETAISYAPVPCLPGRNLCTLEQAVVQDKGPGQYHVYLPANLEWGVSIPLPRDATATVRNARGTVCWDPRLRTTGGCSGPEGNGVIPGDDPEGGAGFVAPRKPAGALVMRMLDGRVWFSVNDRSGEGFRDNEGFFEFDVTIPAK